MKKLFLVFGMLILLLITTLVVAPVFFKDDIKKVIDEAIAGEVDAKVFYDPEGISLSLLKDFPNFTFSMDNFGIAGKGLFEGDTLACVSSFEFTIDLMSVINGQKISLSSISLKEPKFFIIVLENGKANYDIFKSDTSSIKADTATGDEVSVDLAIKKWQIMDGDFVYFDASLGFYTSFDGINHIGTGDFSQNIFDLTTQTSVASFSMSYDGTTYFDNKSLAANVIMEMDLEKSKYTFLENTVSINNLDLAFNGFVSMPSDDISIDITYDGKNLTLKSILSLIPGDYESYLTGVTAAGTVNLDGYVRGIYNEQMLPDVFLKSSISNGSIKYSEFPLPIEEVQMKVELNIPGENMDMLTFSMPHFSMKLEDEEFNAHLNFENLANYTWDFGMQGTLDLGKTLKVIPVEGLQISGKLAGELMTSGNMQLVEEENYEKLPTTGNIRLTDFKFKGEDVPNELSISNAIMGFNNQQVALSAFSGTIGNSDFQMTGSVENFIVYAMGREEPLKAKLNFSSHLFDFNELMSPTAAVDASAVSDTTSLEVLRIPINLAFQLDTKIDRIIYDNLEITDIKGMVSIEEGLSKLEKLDFKLLNGHFVMDGIYNSTILSPSFNFNFKIAELSISESFKAFNTIQKIAPIANDLAGNFSSEMSMTGNLDQTMAPIMETMFAYGVLEIAEASYNNPKWVNALNKITGDKEQSLTSRNLNLQFMIENGKLIVQPFDLKIAGRSATIYGSSGITDAKAPIDYGLETNIKTGKLGNEVNNLIASFTGAQNVISDEVRMKIKIEGTYENPEISLAGITNVSGQSNKSSLKNAAIDAAKKKLQEQQDIAEKKIKEEMAKQKEVVEEKVQEGVNAIKDKVKESLPDELKDIKSQLKNGLKDIKKKKKEGG